MARRIRGREVLRLRSVNGLSQNAIARTAHVSKHSPGRTGGREGAGRLPGERRGDVRGIGLRVAVPRQGRRRTGARRPGLGARPPRDREDRRHAQAPARGVRGQVRRGAQAQAQGQTEGVRSQIARAHIVEHEWGKRR